MIDIIKDYMEFIGITETTPLTIGDFLVWFVMVSVSVAIIKFVLEQIFRLIYFVSKSINPKEK